MADIIGMCRLCGVSIDLGVPLLDPFQKRLTDEVTLSFHLEISPSNGFPARICPVCFKTVEDFISLKETSQVSHQCFCALLNVPLSFGLIESKNGMNILLGDSDVHNSMLTNQPEESDSHLCDREQNLHTHTQTVDSTYEIVDPVEAVPKKTEPRVVLTRIDVNKCISQLSNSESCNEAEKVIDTNLGQFVLDIQSPDVCGEFVKIEPMSDICLEGNNMQLFTEDLSFESNPQSHTSSYRLNYKDDSSCSQVTAGDGLLALKSEITVDELDWHCLPLQTTQDSCSADEMRSQTPEQANTVLCSTFMSPYDGSLEENNDSRISCETGVRRVGSRVKRGQLRDKKKIVADSKEHVDTVPHLSSEDMSNTFPFSCKICSRRFSNKGNLTCHMLIHSKPRFSCSLCDKKCRRKSHLKLHFETQHSGGARNYNCKKCDAKFKSKNTLRNHIKCIHTVDSKQLPWECDQCGKCYKLKGYLRMHKISIHEEAKYSCEDCEMKFRYPSHLKRHIATRHSKVIGNYKCDKCEKKFSRKDTLTSHVKKVHQIRGKNLMSWSCHECGEYFNVKNDLLIHRVIVHRHPVFSCALCGKSYKRKAHLKVHFETQHSEGARNHMCDKCDARFKSKDTLRSHVTCVHKFDSKQLPWKCSDCGKGFKIRRYLRNHKATVHREAKYSCNNLTMKIRLSGNLKLHSISYICDLCQKSFQRKDGLRNHIKNIHQVDCRECHLKQYFCKHKMTAHINEEYCCASCTKTYRHKGDLKRHIQIHHTGSVRYYKCDACEKKFNRIDSLRSHVKKKHKVDMPWQCKECVRCFKLKNDLLRHEVNVHGEAKYACSNCNKEYRRLSQLKQHIVTHHNESDRNYKCAKCEAKYNSVNALRGHIKTVHSAVEKLSWKCGDCGKYFKLKEYLRKHKINVHR